MAMEPVRGEANRLYWETDAPVSLIADQLGLSRRALYELLEPIALPEPCPSCGGRLTYGNRLARSAGEAVCGGCGAHRPTRATVAAGLLRVVEDAPGVSVGDASEAIADQPDGDEETWNGGNGTVDRTRPRAPEPRVRASDYLVAIAAGLAAGLLAALLLARRHD